MRADSDKQSLLYLRCTGQVSLRRPFSMYNLGVLQPRTF